jgi:hypothetical protein
MGFLLSSLGLLNLFITIVVFQKVREHSKASLFRYAGLYQLMTKGVGNMALYHCLPLDVLGQSSTGTAQRPAVTAVGQPCACASFSILSES